MVTREKKRKSKHKKCVQSEPQYFDEELAAKGGAGVYMSRVPSKTSKPLQHGCCLGVRVPKCSPSPTCPRPRS